MDLFHTIILGIIEGATEFLPISSTAHLLIVEKLMKIEASELFNIAVQLGAIIAVIAYAPRRLLMSRKTQIAIITAFIPTAILGFIVKDFSKILHSYIFISIAALFVGGIVMLFLEKKWKTIGEITADELSPKRAMIIGAVQTLAFIPGVSRSAATIYAGLSQGLTRKEAVSFSFFLGIPVMAAATALSLFKVRNEISFDSLTPILIGGSIAFVVALLVMHAFIKWVEKYGFTFFAWYRIVLAIVLSIVFFPL